MICDEDAPSLLSAMYKKGTQAQKRQADASQSGRSMIEMLGVLDIIGVLSVGGIAGYSKAMEKYRANKLISSLDMAIANLQSFQYGKKRGTSFWGHDVSVKANLIPDYLKEDFSFKGGAAGSWGAGGYYSSTGSSYSRDFAVQVVPASMSGTSCGNHFTLHLSGLRTEECIAVYQTYKNTALGIGMGFHYDGSSSTPRLIVYNGDSTLNIIGNGSYGLSSNTVSGADVTVGQIVSACDCDKAPCDLMIYF